MSIINLNVPYYGEYRSYNTFNEVGKTVTFQVDACSNYDCRLYIYTYTGSYSSQWTLVPANTPGTYSVTRTIPQNTEHILYRMEPRNYSSEQSFCYTDNWRLIL